MNPKYEEEIREAAFRQGAEMAMQAMHLGALLATETMSDARAVVAKCAFDGALMAASGEEVPS